MVFQKKGQVFIRSMGYAQLDNDPNSTVRKMAAEQRKISENNDAKRRALGERFEADFDRRMRALGVLPLLVPAHKKAIYIFNDSARQIEFSIVRADGKLADASDVSIDARSHGVMELSLTGGTVYIVANGTLKRWKFNIDDEYGIINRCGGFIYDD